MQCLGCGGLPGQFCGTQLVQFPFPPGSVSQQVLLCGLCGSLALARKVWIVGIGVHSLLFGKAGKISSLCVPMGLAVQLESALSVHSQKL